MRWFCVVAFDMFIMIHIWSERANSGADCGVSGWWSVPLNVVLRLVTTFVPTPFHSSTNITNFQRLCIP